MGSSKDFKIKQKEKNMLLIILVISLFQYTNTSFSSLAERIATNQISGSQYVKKIHSKVILDKEQESCDFTVSEKVLFSYDKLTTSINHVIFSKRFSYYQFEVKISQENIINTDVKILQTKYYSNTSVRKLLYNTLADSNYVTNNFKENWVISVELNNPIKEIEIEFIYKIQNGLYVNAIEKKNIFQYEYINPYASPIENFKLEMEIKNYKLLNKYNVKAPEEGVIETLASNNGLKISLFKKLPELSEYSVSLPLPFEIELCNKSFTNAVNVLLYSITFLITVLGLITCFKLSKE